MTTEVYPNSPPVPVTASRVFPWTHIGGSNSRTFSGMGVEASVGANSTWEMQFDIPDPLPPGTCTLRLRAVANATSGSAKVNPTWNSTAVGENYDTNALNAEGTQTLTWSTGNNDDILELTVTLDADTPVAGEILHMQLIFETTSWTLAQISTWKAAVTWV